MKNCRKIIVPEAPPLVGFGGAQERSGADEKEIKTPSGWQAESSSVKPCLLIGDPSVVMSALHRIKPIDEPLGHLPPLKGKLKIIRSGHFCDIDGLSATSGFFLMPNCRTAITVAGTEIGSMHGRTSQGVSFRVPIQNNDAKNIRVWDLVSGECISSMHLKLWPYRVYCNEGKALVITNEDRLRIFDLLERKNFFVMPIKPERFLISPQLKFFGNYLNDKKWGIWRLYEGSGVKVSEIDFSDSAPNTIEFSEDETKVISSHLTSEKRMGEETKSWSPHDRNTTVKVWDIESGNLDFVCQLDTPWAHRVEMDMGRVSILTWSGQNTLDVWSREEGFRRPTSSLDVGDKIRHLVVDRADLGFAVTTGVNTPGVSLWSLESGKKLDSLEFAKPMLMTPLVSNSNHFCLLGWDRSYHLLNII